MTPSGLLKEAAFPVTDTVVLLALLGATGLSLVFNAAGRIGLILALLVLPALFRYLLRLLEARAAGRAVPVAGLELFDVAEHFWSLTPSVLIAAAAWALVLADHAPLAALCALLVAAILPASVAVLAITHSPFESLNPVVVGRMIKACGRDYLAIPLLFVATGFLAWLGARMNLPNVVVVAWSFYGLFLLFTFTGAVLHEHGVELLVGIPEATEIGDDAVASSRVRTRQQALTHAYGFFSRNNAAGGLAHIQAAAAEEPDPDEAWDWYFRQMLEWESTEPALRLGQAHLGRLLAKERDVEALKVITRCALIDPAFRPLPGDRPAALAAATRYRRDDLMKNLA